MHLVGRTMLKVWGRPREGVITTNTNPNGSVQSALSLHMTLSLPGLRHIVTQTLYSSISVKYSLGHMLRCYTAAMVRSKLPAMS